MKILIADDRSAVRSALRLTFEIRRPDCLVEEAATLQAILFAVELDCPDVLLIDWEMQPQSSHNPLPNVHWQNIVAAIRRRCPCLRIIVMSSEPFVEKDARQAGANAFVCKSDPPEQLLQIVNQQLAAVQLESLDDVDVSAVFL